MQSEEVSLRRLKLSNEARLADEERLQSRRKALLVLIMQHLQAEGYAEACSVLQREAGGAAAKMTVADNVDLMTVLHDYEEFYGLKFGKPPKLIRKAQDSDKAVTRNGGSGKRPTLISEDFAAAAEQRGPSLAKERRAVLPQISAVPSSPPPPPAAAAAPLKPPRNVPGTGNLSDRIAPRAPASSVEAKAEAEPRGEHAEAAGQGQEPRLLKPFPATFYENLEFRELSAIIQRDIFVANPDVRWADVAGQDASKRVLREAVIWPMKYPELFTGIATPWKGLLMFGPPGTGKTMLAKAVATECRTTFFNISASSIVSKWRGDSEKLVRVLFEMARFHAPSTIFLDELESIMGSRSAEGDHEGSRRMKTELLIQMDGLARTSDSVFLLAASNLPWQLDQAMLRRLEKRILIDLPDREARRAIFAGSLPTTLRDSFGNAVVSADLDHGALADLTDGYSGADLNLVCKEAAMRPLRKIFKRLEKLDMFADTPSPEMLKRDAVIMEDVHASIAVTRPSCDQSLGTKYKQWQQDFGSQ